MKQLPEGKRMFVCYRLPSILPNPKIYFAFTAKPNKKMPNSTYRAI